MFGTEEEVPRDRNLYDRFTSIVGRTIGYGSVAASVALLGWEVIARYVLHTPTKFTLEYGLICQVLIGAFAGAYVLQKGGHVGIDLVTTRLSPRTRKTFDLFNLACGALFCGLLVFIMFRATQYAWKMDTRTETLELALWPIYALLVIGLAMIAGQFINEIVKMLRKQGAGA